MSIRTRFGKKTDNSGQLHLVKQRSSCGKKTSPLNLTVNVNCLIGIQYYVENNLSREQLRSQSLSVSLLTRSPFQLHSLQGFVPIYSPVQHASKKSLTSTLLISVYVIRYVNDKYHKSVKRSNTRFRLTIFEHYPLKTRLEFSPGKIVKSNENRTFEFQGKIEAISKATTKENNFFSSSRLQIDNVTFNQIKARGEFPAHLWLLWLFFAS